MRLRFGANSLLFRAGASRASGNCRASLDAASAFLMSASSFLTCVGTTGLEVVVITDAIV